jgi:hypothetical protein
MTATAIVGLWVPVVVFAHLFSAFWFIKTWLVYDPRPLAVLRRKRPSATGLPTSTSTAAEDDSKAVDEVLELESASKSSLSSKPPLIRESSTFYSAL